MDEIIKEILKVKSNFSDAEVRATRAITQDLLGGQVERGIVRLRSLKDEIYAAIPANLRIGRGITWVVERISTLLTAQGLPDGNLRELAGIIYSNLDGDDLTIGVAIFLMAEHGVRLPKEVLEFFERAACSQNWVMREYAAGAFRKVIGQNKDIVLPWLQENALSKDPFLRRFSSETLRPVTHNKWLNQQPEYSISVLKLMFKESHPYPRTSVGNNLSDLSRQQPELIFGIVIDLVASGDENSYWIAYRACRNIVKKEPVRVMKLLQLEEYHYKDRNFKITENQVLQT
jgi:3-methyladenine DNA glycosylase AlkC